MAKDEKAAAAPAEKKPEEKKDKAQARRRPRKGPGEEGGRSKKDHYAVNGGQARAEEDATAPSAVPGCSSRSTRTATPAVSVGTPSSRPRSKALCDRLKPFQSLLSRLRTRSGMT